MLVLDQTKKRKKGKREGEGEGGREKDENEPCPISRRKEGRGRGEEARSGRKRDGGNGLIPVPLLLPPPVGEREKLKESASRAKRVDSLSSLFYKTRSLFCSGPCCTLSHRGVSSALSRLSLSPLPLSSRLRGLTEDSRHASSRSDDTRDEFSTDRPASPYIVSTGRVKFARKIRAANYERVVARAFSPRMIYRYRLPIDHRSLQLSADTRS